MTRKLLIASLIVIQFYVLQYRWWVSVLYCFLFIVVPLLQVLRKLYAATVSADYYQLSKLIKVIMLTGILSMIFFKLYNTWIA